MLLRGAYGRLSQLKPPESPLANFQLLGVEINIGGDRDNTVVKDRFDPVTFPEYLVLQALHGGPDHVHSAVVVGHSERPSPVEKERLALKYGGDLVSALFPGAMATLPEGDVSIPTIEEVEAGNAASKEARKIVRKSAPKAPIAQGGGLVGSGGLPDLTA